MTPTSSPATASIEIDASLGPLVAQPENQRKNELLSLASKIQPLSERLFPGPVTFEYAFDPEDSANEYIVFDVVAQGDFADYRQRIFQWHDEVEALVPGTTTEFRLIVHPLQ